MTTRQDPASGNFLSSGPGLNLTPSQRSAAFFCDEMAADLLPILDSGKPWFTAYEIRQKPEFLETLVTLGLITKHKSTKHDGHYYKRTPYTRPFLLTALALRDERVKAQQERTSGS